MKTMLRLNECHNTKFNHALSERFTGRHLDVTSPSRSEKAYDLPKHFHTAMVSMYALS